MNNTPDQNSTPTADEVARVFFGLPPETEAPPESDEDAAARAFFGLTKRTDN